MTFATRLRRKLAARVCQRVAVGVAFALSAGLTAVNAAAKDDLATGRFILQFQSGTSAPAPKILVPTAGVTVELTAKRSLYDGSMVYSAKRSDGKPLTATDAEAVAKSLSGKSQVEAARPTRKVSLHGVTINDQLAPLQWYYKAAAPGIDSFKAWDITTGNANVVVAVVDSGIVPHVDLNGRILPGFDFVSLGEDGQARRAGDGDGRDADATDPGDWATAADVDYFKAQGIACAVGDSNWHGLAVAGVIGAVVNNGQGIAGLDWKARILPVRAVGRCGGDDADLIDAIAWAGGLTVEGARPNTTPAAVINISVGGVGACDTVMEKVFRDVFAAGRTKAIVVSAGNESANASDSFPGNCPQAINVAAVGEKGQLAPYSNTGAVTLAAPGGDVKADGKGIVALYNTGKTVAERDTYAQVEGTSFSAPLVAGTVSLMLSANPALTAQDIRLILTQTASPFTNGTCSFAGCGFGLLNAGAAVRAAQLALAEPPASALPLPAPGTVLGYPLVTATATANFSDFWYEPDEGGWGISIAQKPGRTPSVTWYTYDRGGTPAWHFGTAIVWTDTDVLTGNFGTYSGPSPAANHNSASVTQRFAGRFRLEFVDAQTMRATIIPFVGNPVVKTLKRLPF